MSDDWTEKYRPKSLSGVIGNPSAVEDLRKWALSWNNGIPKKRAVVLIGTPGIGKTTSAEALAADMGWGIVEMNSSDQRTGDIIRDIAFKGAYFNTFNDEGTYLNSKDGGRKLIILDEADSLFGTADRGALPAINELVKTTQQPVILIVNDFYALSKKSAAIKTDTIQISFRKPTARSIASALKIIADKEKVSVSPIVLDKIATNAGGDMRAAVRDLESLSLGETVVSVESANQLSERIVKKDMYALMDAIFRKNDPMGARAMLSKTSSDPESAILWVDENLPYEYRDTGDLVRGYEKLARADIFLGRVHRRQYYRFWAYAGDLMTAGVSSSKLSQMTSHDRIRFPLYLMKMSRSKAVRAVKYSVCFKLATFLHTSTNRVQFDILLTVKELAKNDADIRSFLIKEVGMDEEELAFILDCKMDSDIVKLAMAESSLDETAPESKKETPKKAEVPTAKTMPATKAEEPIKAEEKAKPAEHAPEAKKVQRNLFDF